MTKAFIEMGYVMLKRKDAFLFVVFVFLLTLRANSQNSFSADKQMEYSITQIKKTIKADTISTEKNIPRSIASGSKDWRYVDYKDWTSGFWPGVLWYGYEYSHDKKLEVEADKFSEELKPLAFNPVYDHDLGFQMNCSFGNGYRLTKDNAYKNILLAAADTLATLFNPKVGTILSWPREVKGFGAHNTIMDNIMNLELLFWASKNGGSKRLYDIAVSHANKTMQNQFRADYSCYHVVLYDSITGKVIKRITHQGFADNSMWARGQSWAIYGYTMCYRETRNPKYLDFAQKVASIYIKRLPDDLIPYWDFDDTSIPNTPKDVSAAAVTASALLELSGYVKDTDKASFYKDKAVAMLKAISAEKNLSRNVNNAILLHSTGHKPHNSEVDASIIYADYYYMEALLRLRKMGL